MKIQSERLQKYRVNTIVGELNGEQLRNTALDVNNRISVKYTVEDVEKELAVFNKLHGPSKKDLDERKIMMSKYKIRRDDLDN